MPGQWTELPGRGVVEVRGADARHFLHNLVTTNIDKVAPGTAGYGALLTPQGKVLFDFLVFDSGAGFLLDVAADKAADLARRLGFYKLRAAIEIADRSVELRVIASWGGEPAPASALASSIDPRLADLGQRAVLPVAAVEALERSGKASPEAFDAHRLALGVPEGGRDFAFGDAFPHDADMDQLGGIDFTKGCYTGQEVVSRMEHRGTARRRVIAVTATAALPAPGTPVLAGEIEIGVLGSVNGGSGLASIRLDRAADAMRAGQVITAAGVPIVLSIPVWARFGWPEAAVG